MQVPRVVIAIIIVIMIWSAYHHWLVINPQSGGGSVAPGVYDQLDDLGPMNQYLTGDMDDGQQVPDYYQSYGPPFRYPKYFNGPPYNYQTSDNFQPPYV